MQQGLRIDFSNIYRRYNHCKTIVNKIAEINLTPRQDANLAELTQTLH